VKNVRSILPALLKNYNILEKLERPYTYTAEWVNTGNGNTIKRNLQSKSKSKSKRQSKEKHATVM
jgi:hypothetical protein